MKMTMKILLDRFKERYGVSLQTVCRKNGPDEGEAIHAWKHDFSMIFYSKLQTLLTLTKQVCSLNTLHTKHLLLKEKAFKVAANMANIAMNTLYSL